MLIKLKAEVEGADSQAMIAFLQELLFYLEDEGDNLPNLIDKGVIQKQGVEKDSNEEEYDFEWEYEVSDET